MDAVAILGLVVLTAVTFGLLRLCDRMMGEGPRKNDPAGRV